ncbi:MAG: GTPase ObgE [Candidatus Omnitrophica bacterium]|nr:GTPase ObgE [Candidatus Omnitrophota bacterium]
MFIDQARIYVKAGQGGKGCRSFYRDMYTPRGIPDGGDGGRGADIIIRADRHLRTLLDFKYNRHFYGPSGGHGSGKNKKGKDAPAVIIRVPVGTVVKDIRTNCLLRDLKKDQDELVVARGGRGGSGNRHHGSEVTEYESGEEKELLLDLKLIADVGVVGFPNAGKSTLVSSISNAHPEIAAYPFTTKFPALGVVSSGDASFVIADIPGLIEGSSAGRGLGDKFLRHVERTKILVHLIDISGFEGRDPVRDYRTINQELKKYSSQVYAKPQIIAANKIDLENARENLKDFRKRVKKKVYPISALKKQGLEELIEAIRKRL